MTTKSIQIGIFAFALQNSECLDEEPDVGKLLVRFREGLRSNFCNTAMGVPLSTRQISV